MNPNQPLQIMDIAPNITSPWPDKLWLILGVVSVMFILLGLRFLQKKFKQRQRFKKNLLPHEDALQKLKELPNQFHLPLDQRYLILTDVVKNYITLELGLSLTEKTIEEMRSIQPELKKRLPTFEEPLWDLFVKSEKIKFAKQMGMEESFLQEIKFVERLVESVHKQFKENNNASTF